MRQLLTRKHRAVACLLALTGCVHDGAGPPKWIDDYSILTRVASGYVDTRFYYTAAQASDRRWEAKRAPSPEWIRNNCESGKASVSRDIRWFPATPISGQVCAAIIYTVRCSGEGAGADADLAENHREMMLGELGAVPEKACGEKDSLRRPPSYFDDYINEYRRGQALLVDRPVCDLTTPTLDGAITITARTRVATNVAVDRALIVRYIDQNTNLRLDRIVAGRVGQSLLRAGMLPNIFTRDGIVSDDPANIRLTLTFGLNRDGRPHCVQLTARQGGRTWRRTIDRTGRIDPGPLVFSRSRGTGGRPTPTDDADSLADALRAAMGLPEVISVPVKRTS